MQDNFNLAKYLRQGNKLLNENIGGYVDLKPINHLSEDSQTDTYGVDNENDVVTIDLDMAWDDDAAAQAAFDQYGIEVQPTGGNPGTFEVTGRKGDVLAYLKSEYYGMDDQDIATFYPELLDGGANDSMSLEELMGTAMEIEELEKPEKIYADDEEKYDNQDRMFDLGGQQIEQGIIDLLDDGFEADEVLEMCKMFIDAHVQAAAQGNKF
jgi:hypothetical protein